MQGPGSIFSALFPLHSEKPLYIESESASTFLILKTQLYQGFLAIFFVSISNNKEAQKSPPYWTLKNKAHPYFFLSSR
jgi:hypothetical protein